MGGYSSIVSGVFFCETNFNNAQNELKQNQLHIVKINEHNYKYNKVGTFAQATQRAPNKKSDSVIQSLVHLTISSIGAALFGAIALFSFWDSENLQLTYMLISLCSAAGFVLGNSFSKRIKFLNATSDETTPRIIEIKAQNSKEILQAKSILYQNNAVDIKSH